MILVSCRADFAHTDWFSTTLEITDYPKLPAVDGSDSLTVGQLVSAVEAKHVLVLVHGFRNTFADVASAYSELEATLIAKQLRAPGNYDMVIGFLWPGFATPLGFFPAIPFANRSAAFLRELIGLLNGHAHTVDIETHSLGARVGLQALAFQPELFVDNLLLTAPAVGDDVLERLREFNGSLQSVRRCIVYHSVNDPVLKTAYRLAEFDAALGWHGPQDPALIASDCPEVFVVNCADVVHTHSGYRSAGAVFEHWGRVLAETPLPRLETLVALPGEVPV